MITALLSFLTFAIGYILGFIISDMNRKDKVVYVPAGGSWTNVGITKWDEITERETEFSSNDEMQHPNKG